MFCGDLNQPKIVVYSVLTFYFSANKIKEYKLF